MKIVTKEEYKNVLCSNDTSDNVRRIVVEILEEVKTTGNKAVTKYTQKFDDPDLKKSEKLEVTKEEIKEAYMKVDTKDVTVLKKAAENITFFAKKQLEQLRGFSIERDGMLLGQKVVPIQRVGCYVPGGRYPYPSTALMTVIPAKVAGVKEIVVCSPKIAPITIVAADIAGADKIYRIGGIQAVGAMAYGTESISKVDKIVGPGNQYVAAAKKEVYGSVGIDFIAGPTEVLIVADETGNARFIAADLLAQAEHDPNALPNFVTTSRELAEKVNIELDKQLATLETKEVAAQALEKGRMIVVDSMEEAVDLANYIAPEHLELQVRDVKRIIDKFVNYGSLFIGEYSAEVFGDYCAGPNHSLPTGQAARYTGGLSVKDFVKLLTFQEITKEGAEGLINTASALGKMEGLYGHSKAAEIRKTCVK